MVLIICLSAQDPILFQKDIKISIIVYYSLDLLLFDLVLLLSAFSVFSILFLIHQYTLPHLIV